MDSVATAQLAQPASQPLAALLRAQIDGDRELRRLHGELKTHLMRGGALAVRRHRDQQSLAVVNHHRRHRTATTKSFDSDAA